MPPEFIQADATRLPFADASVDLVFGSPPYCDARTYGIGCRYTCQEWIDWMMKVTAEAVRVSRGLVIWVCAGVTRDHCYWPACEGLLYSWWRNGGNCWRPAYWHRVGIPGSGGKQWLRADVEYCLAFSREGKIPWAENTACGRVPKMGRGDGMSNRGKKCARLVLTKPEREEVEKLMGQGMSQRSAARMAGIPLKTITSGTNDSGTITAPTYVPPVIANPGNLIRTKAGSGHMGNPIAHENEAPFPEKLAEFFLLSWCPPGGTVLDPFSGSGTTVATAMKNNRHGIGCDLRLSQCELGRRRTADITPGLF